MKRVIGILLATGVCLFVIGSNIVQNQKILAPVQYKTVAEIVAGETRHLTSPTDKVKTIHNWIAQNIQYDVAQIKSRKEYFDSQQFVDEVLQTRKGICQHYAELFQACCKLSGIECYVILGYTNQKGIFTGLGHAWNALKFGEKYYMVDVTWDAGFFDENNKYTHKLSDKFLLITPPEFIKTHMSFDPVWQLLSNPLSTSDFEKGDFSKLAKASNFNFADSIKGMQVLELKEKLLRQNKRMAKNGVSNPLVREQIAHNQLLIVNEKCNSAVLLFNDAVASYNSYILQKNKQFQKTSLPDNQILELLADSRTKTEAAENILTFLSTGDSELVKRIEAMQQSTAELKRKLSDEDEFMKKYLKTAKPLRLFLFRDNAKKKSN